MINLDVDYYTFLSILIIFLLIVIILLKSTENSKNSQNNSNSQNNNSINNYQNDCEKSLCVDDDNFNYCIYRNNTYFGTCPITNTMNASYYNINTNGVLICQFQNLMMYSCKFVNSFISNINNCFFGYSTGTGLYTHFEKCLFDVIQNTDFQRAVFYRKNLINNVFLTNVSFDNVKFKDDYYLFNIVDNVLMFSTCSFGDYTIFDLNSLGKTPTYVNVNANINEVMGPDKVYYFNGIGYIWTVMGDKIRLVRMNYT